MRQMSDRFAATIGESHKVAVDAKVITPTGLTPIDVLDGSVTLSATAESRGSCDLTVPLDLAPENPTDLLAPYGNEVVLGRGIDYGDGTTEICPLGTYRIDSVDVTGDGVSLTGIDRSIKVIDAVFEAPYTQTGGVNIVTAIAFLIAFGDASVTMRFATTSLTTSSDPLLFADTGTDRWDFCLGLAEAIGCNLYFDRDGVCVLEPSPTGLSPAILTIAEGRGGVLLDASRNWGREDAVNRVLVTGESNSETGDVPTGEARDTNPLSPTYYGGPFGKVTFPYSSSYVTTDAQAAHVAAVMLAQKLGTTQSVSFGSLVDPRLDPFDVVNVVRESIGVNESHVIDSVTIPLGLGQMSATTRAAQVST